MNRYKIHVGNDLPGTYDTFKQALKALFDEVKTRLNSGLSYQLLETTSWIENTNTGDVRYFYDARDMGYFLGIVADGNVVE